MSGAGNPWEDAGRFATRRYLPSLQRETTPLFATTALDAGLGQQVAAAWAAALAWPDGTAAHADEVVLCAGAREALTLGLGGLLAPDDVVLVARPTAPDALAAVLGRGAGFVDIGRLHDGAVDPQAAARAADRHPTAVAFVEAPSLMADDDLDAWAAIAVRARVVDLRHAGWPARLPAADATLLALRDPEDPARPLLWAVVARREAAALLAVIGGAAEFPVGVLARAAALLRSLAADPAWVTAALERLAERAHALRDLAAAHPGGRLHAAGPLRVVASCAAGDADVLATRWRPHAVAVAAYGDHPMRHLAVAELDPGGP